MLKRHLFTTLTALLALIGSTAVANVAHAAPAAPTQDSETFTLSTENPPLSVDGVGGYSEEEVAEMQEFFRTVEQNIDETTAQETLTPGEMWSDSIELPDAVDKAEADQAELMIAEEQESGVASRWQSRAPRCRIFWPSPHRVCGAILQAYEQLGGMTSWLLFPIEAESINPDLQGYRQRFANGFIYWHPNTGAHPVSTHASLIWSNLGWETGMLGYPTSSEILRTEGLAISQRFQHGAALLTLAGASAMFNDAFRTWELQGAERGPLGYPLGLPNETIYPEGRTQVFTGGITISDQHRDALPVYGEVFDQWITDFENDKLIGLPTQAPQKTARNRVSQVFEHQTLNGKSFGNLASDVMSHVFLPFKTQEAADEFFEFAYSALNQVEQLRDEFLPRNTRNDRDQPRRRQLLGEIANLMGGYLFGGRCTVRMDNIHKRSPQSGPDWKIGWKPQTTCTTDRAITVTHTNTLKYLGDSEELWLQVPLDSGRVASGAAIKFQQKDIEYRCIREGKITYKGITKVVIKQAYGDPLHAVAETAKAHKTKCIGRK
jgi:putative secreted protein